MAITFSMTPDGEVIALLPQRGLCGYVASNDQVLERPLYPEMHDHPGRIDTQQRHAKCATHTLSEHSEEHA